MAKSREVEPQSGQAQAEALASAEVSGRLHSRQKVWSARRSQAVISEWLFPAPSSPAEPISRHLLRDWWERGQALAKLPTELGRGWHSLRRQFATELKHAPLKDLCALGGWKSPQTVLICYQKADSVSMQQALATRRRLEA
jgi:integrase